VLSRAAATKYFSNIVTGPAVAMSAAALGYVLTLMDFIDYNELLVVLIIMLFFGLNQHF